MRSLDTAFLDTAMGLVTTTARYFWHFMTMHQEASKNHRIKWKAEQDEILSKR